MRKYLTRSEVEQLVQAAGQGLNARRNVCMITMCFIHGLRVSELCRLQLQQLDLKGRTIYIQRSKNGFSTIHPLISAELPCLMAWLEERKTWSHGDSEWLFPSRKGGPLTRQQVYHIFTQYGKIAGISIVPHPHTLRHACGYALADRGADTRLIQDYLGHKNIQHTVIYTAANSQRFINVWEEQQESSIQPILSSVSGR